MLRTMIGLALCVVVGSGCGSEQKSPSSDQVDTGDDVTGDQDPGAPEAGRKDASSSSGSTKDAGVKRDASKSEDDNDNSCSTQNISAMANPPDILIVLDRSLSMELGGRWQPSATAVKDLTSEFDNTVQFGLMTFPSPAGLGGCDPGVIDVPLAPMNASAVNSFIDMSGPGGLTPTADTLKGALDALGDRTVVADGRVKPAYVLLVTDGEPDCPSLDNPDPGPGAVNAVTALNEAGIKTYVIGYNLAAGADLMNQMAVAGGTDKYFEVENQQDITDAFHQITKDIVKCQFELSEAPRDPGYVRVTIDGNTVVLDAADGWKLDGTTITLEDAQCDVLKDGENHQLQVKIECAPVL